MEEEEESDPEEAAPPFIPFGDVPLLNYPLQSAPSSSSDHPPIWDQILNNQLAMQGQLTEMSFHQQQLACHQRWSTKLGNSLLNPVITLILHLLPLRMIEGVLLSFPLFTFICFYFMPLGTMSHFKCGGRDRLLLVYY